MAHKLDQPLSNKFDEALRWATELHREQARKGTQIPYISHPLAVSSLVLENGGTEDQAIAALLHDVVEDCGGAKLLADIRGKFGDTVKRIVDSCSDSFEAGPKRDWRDRKESYIKHLDNCDPEALLVVAADKLHNLMSIERDLDRVGDQVWKRFNAGVPELAWYYDAVIRVLRDRLNEPIVNDIETVFGRVCS